MNNKSDPNHTRSSSPASTRASRMRDAAISDLKSGMSPYRVMRKYDRSASWLYNLEPGILRERGRAVREQIIERLRAGDTVKDIANDFNRSYASVSAIAKQNDIQAASGYRFIHKGTTAIEILAYVMKHPKKSLADVARHFNVSRSRVGAIVREARDSGMPHLGRQSKDVA